MTDPLSAKFTFLNEADRLKSVERANWLTNRSRPENAAEHSWHVALAMMVMAEHAEPGVDLDSALRMALLHDLVEIDAGDHPIHLPHDPAAVALAEAQGADRLYGLLPHTGPHLRAQWEEFETARTATARYAKAIDHLSSVWLALASVPRDGEEMAICTDNLRDGRVSRSAQHVPDLLEATRAWADNRQVTPRLRQSLAFLGEVDKLKCELRASRLIDGSRHENSAEHSWHIALYALVLGDQAADGVAIARVIQMLILHDIVEIDAGDAPIHGDHDPVALEAAERAAADRLFGLLPTDIATQFRTLWEEFEAAETPDSIFAKSIDRVQPVLGNLANGGGSWVDYDVTFAQLDARVGTKISRGAPAIWAHVKDLCLTWFVEHGRI